MVHRVYVEKKPGFDGEKQRATKEIKELLNLPQLENLVLLYRYDVEGIKPEQIMVVAEKIFSDPVTDLLWLEEHPWSQKKHSLVVEYVPGQFDQRADSAEQLIRIEAPGSSPRVRFARVFLWDGDFAKEELERIHGHFINPVDSWEGKVEKPDSLQNQVVIPEKIVQIAGFLHHFPEDLVRLKEEMGLAMSLEDLECVQKYFLQEDRDPTETEIRVLDTYWSDHCRHTTFRTKLDYIRFNEDPYSQMIKETFEEYLSMRRRVYGDETKDISLMDLATIGAQFFRGEGKLESLDLSEEVNACTIRVPIAVEGVLEDWLILFKNETHNHPTEIEPFGGAATCLGGAIRDPLSGRAYVYQAMRVTGSGDPRTPFEKTLPGKLPQRVISREAARGYSSYGNQIGLATGQVTEIYHEGYVAKRMEVGAVVGACPASHVIREIPAVGDSILLVGGRTGRDGIGGATGSSKIQGVESLRESGAEVQKGNPLIERNLLRLFRRKEASTLIKRCNDFGAGGVSVAVGELADSLWVDLDLLEKKYDGLNGTELALSESQERMAVVVAPENEETFIRLAREENLEAYFIGRVTDTGAFQMDWKGSRILSLKRTFLNTNGAPQQAAVTVKPEANLRFLGQSLLSSRDQEGLSLAQKVETYLIDINHCCQKGLSQHFDSTIGASTVLMPYGGTYQMTPSVGMAAKLPTAPRDTEDVSLMSFGFDPFISTVSPYHGGMLAVLDSLTKLVCMGGNLKQAWMSFQEYYPRLTDSDSWAKPFAALLGALKAQKELEVASIGGKDSMSGTYENISVPPTLISFALGLTTIHKVITPEWKRAGSILVWLSPGYDNDFLPDFTKFKLNMSKLGEWNDKGMVLSAYPVGRGGLFVAAMKMALGNRVGAEISNLHVKDLFSSWYGSVLVELKQEWLASEYRLFPGCSIVGSTNEEEALFLNIEEEKLKISLKEMEEKWVQPLEGVFPTQLKKKEDNENIPAIDYPERSNLKSRKSYAKPRVLVPVFPGTNCEMDSFVAFEKAGGLPKIQVLQNLTKEELRRSLEILTKNIANSQIIMLPGGFSGGDEPDGTGKFIASIFGDEQVKEALHYFLNERKGLILGICNGFQGLIKMGLLPQGTLVKRCENHPILAGNSIGRHQSELVRTRVSSVRSPWMEGIELGEIYTLPISHGEGRFVAPMEQLQEMARNGQIATQYVGIDGKPTMEISGNPNGSCWGIEGVFSPDGLIFGKMAHSERVSRGVYQNITGNFYQPIFEAGIKYYR